jgi:hypothetical protein
MAGQKNSSAAYAKLLAESKCNQQQPIANADTQTGASAEPLE